MANRGTQLPSQRPAVRHESPSYAPPDLPHTGDGGTPMLFSRQLCKDNPTSVEDMRAGCSSWLVLPQCPQPSHSCRK